MADPEAAHRRTARRHAASVARALAQKYGDAECALEHASPLELLVATILSAQCTDQRVNLVTPDLFRKYRSAADFANAPLVELEAAIRSTGFYRNKARNIQSCCRRLVEEFHGIVPRELEALVKLPGVGRKTANVVLGTAFGLPSGVVVDTHVTRLSRRLGLTKAKDAVKIERDLMALLPPEEWIAFSHRLIHHGRQVCKARRPDCEHCSLAAICPRIGVADKTSVAAKTEGHKTKTAKLAPKGSAAKTGSAVKASATNSLKSANNSKTTPKKLRVPGREAVSK
jgi:endonuclease-3